MTKQDAPDVTKETANVTPPDVAKQNADAKAANSAPANDAPDVTGDTAPGADQGGTGATLQNDRPADGSGDTPPTPTGAPAVTAQATPAPAPTPEAAKPSRRSKTRTETPDKTASAKATDEANAKATDPAKIKAEQSGDPAAVLAEKLAAVGLTPEQIADVTGDLDNAVNAAVEKAMDGLLIPKAAATPAPANPPANLPADLREQMAADLKRLNVLEARASANPAANINRGAADEARARRDAALAAQDAATGRAAMRSAQVYGGLEGGEYGLNPADPTNRARVMVGEVPAAPDTGAANGVAASGKADAQTGAAAPTQGQMRPLPEHVPGLVQGPVNPVAAPAIPGPSGAPAPTNLPDAAKGS